VLGSASDGIFVAPSGPDVYNPDISSCGALFQSGTTWAASMNDSLVVAFTARSAADGTMGVYRSPSLTPLVPDVELTGVPLAVINNSGRVGFVGYVDGRLGVYSTSDGVKPFERASGTASPRPASFQSTTRMPWHMGQRPERI